MANAYYTPTSSLADSKSLMLAITPSRWLTEAQRRAMRARKVLGVAGAVYAVSFGAAVGVEALGKDTQADIRRQERVVRVEWQTSKKDKREVKRIERQIGAKCLPFIKFYNNEGFLPQVQINKAAHQLASDESQACGHSPMRLEGELTSYQAATEARIEDHQRLDADRRKLGDIVHSAQRSTGDVLLDSAKWSVIADLSLGALTLVVGVDADGGI